MELFFLFARWSRFDLSVPPARFRQSEDANVPRPVPRRDTLHHAGDQGGWSPGAVSRAGPGGHTQHDGGVHTIYDIRHMSSK